MTPAHGVPRVLGGGPAHGVPHPAGGGAPRFPEGTPAHGVPQVRGGHPEQHEGGGGWGRPSGVREWPAALGPGVAFPRQQGRGQRWADLTGPRQDYVDAFAPDEDDDSVPRPRSRTGASAPRARVADRDSGRAGGAGAGHGTDGAAPAGGSAARGGKGRTFVGVVAAVVAVVLAVVVAGQVADGRDGQGAQPRSADDRARDVRDPASRADGRSAPPVSAETTPPTYEQKMDEKYPLSPTLKGPGTFDAVPGVDKAPGKGRKLTYRVDVEKGLGLDGELFAQAVQKTLNDDRSWAHGGALAFERIHSGHPDFVITLASPGTTADWCAKSGLDTTIDNVSCDSAATERVMINAYRWAQGSETYGDEIHAYRQMLINHEVGHRLGHSHVTCDKDGELAPVMQQQTKFLDPREGIHCLPNPWPYPGG
ncbi:hypothetical protein SUDANB6_02070 [Streptomyces sp. enrichment culture]